MDSPQMMGNQVGKAEEQGKEEKKEREEDEEARSTSEDDADEDVKDMTGRQDGEEEMVTGAAAEFRERGESALWRSFRWECKRF